MQPVEIKVTVDPRLHIFVGPAQRAAAATVRCDGVSTLGHVVESLGVPLTEVGALRANGDEIAPGYVPIAGDHIEIDAIPLPQPPPHVDEPPRFLLDIHLGTLARRMRLLGLDTAYETPDIGDAALAARSAAEGRIMLSRDRGLLHRRELFAGAYIYSHRPAQQLDEVLTRFAPTLAPWTRCTACNGVLREVAKEDVSGRLPDGTQRSYETFAECSECGQAYWRGAHAGHLDAIVQHALDHVASAATPPAP
jgi:uncharacterized protein with PIN domain